MKSICPVCYNVSRGWLILNALFLNHKGLGVVLAITAGFAVYVLRAWITFEGDH